MIIHRPDRHIRAALAVLLTLGVLSGGGAALAQTATPSDHNWVPLLAGDSDHLVLAQVRPAESRLFGRGVTDNFTLRAAVDAPLAWCVSAAERLYVFVDDGRFFSLIDNSWTVERNLPDMALPAQISAHDALVYALVTPAIAARLPALLPADKAATTQPFDPGSASLCITRFDSRGWAGLAPCPESVTPSQEQRLAPRVGWFSDQPALFWVTGEDGVLNYATLDTDQPHWSPPSVVPDIPHVRGFWITTVSRVPTLVIAALRDGGGEQLLALRYLGSQRTGRAQWRATDLHLTNPPNDLRAGRYEQAIGFNQHLALLVTGQPATPFLQFGRIDAQPAEPSLLIDDIVTGRNSPPEGPRWVQSVTVMVLFGVLIALFVFRRGAMVQIIELPESIAVALTLQRLIAALIDLAPFLIVFAFFFGLDWQSTMQDLFGWAAGTDAASGKLPPVKALAWWGSSTGAYSCYALIMELATRRTLGKVLLGTRVISERLAPASAMQIVVRNISRFVELLPPLWVLLFLLVLSRNHQRTGDIFARTIVIRRTSLPPIESDNDDEEDEQV